MTSEEAVLFEQGRQRQTSEAGARLPQKFTACAGAGRGGDVTVHHDVGTPKRSKRLVLLLYLSDSILAMSRRAG